MCKEDLAVVIFRNNLRINDNPSLYYATKEHKNVIALYSYEILLGKYLGFEKCGPYKKSFIEQTLLSLKNDLQTYSINLIIVSDFKKTLEDLNSQYDLTMYYEHEVGTDEVSLEQVFKKYPHKSFFYQTLIEPFEFDYKKSFTHFRKKAEKQLIKEPLPKPLRVNSMEYPSLDISSPIQTLFKGGEESALDRVEYYLDNFIHKYYDTRFLVDGIDNSTKFSPYLSVGAISPRTIFQKLKQKEESTYQSKSSYWIYFELLWRDFFHLVMHQSFNKLFLLEGLKGIQYNFNKDDQSMQDFFEAKTGIDIIDASIIELKTTGWLSNRNRQLIGSYYCKNLGLNHRYLAAFMQHYLIDFNPANHYGNIAYQAFVGNDSTNRVFDPMKQSKMYGGKEYIKKWLNKEETIPQFDYHELANKNLKKVYSMDDTFK